MASDLIEAGHEVFETAVVNSEVKTALAKYRGPRNWKSVLQLLLTMSLFAGSWILMWYSLSISYWLTALLALPTAGMAVRLFILQHDCGHGSFFSAAKANHLVGTMLSALTLTPYYCWRRQHAIHHASNGQLDHRGIGDIDTMTVEEYRNASRWRRLAYRLYRNPFVLFGIGPIFHFTVLQRFTYSLPREWKRERRSVHFTNVLVVSVIALLVWLVGPLAFIKVHLPVMVISASLGVWLFYVQHQFDPAHWRRDQDWDYYTAAIEGSSYLDLPWILHWITGYIGYHHVHHLDSRIPNYALARSAQAHPSLNRATRITIWSSLRCVNLKLWDERAGQLISFREARRRYR
ncbi:MAG: fatty acid desaturase [Planctomycetaceae bacterium]|nr:fatty acid desaturase [Planctomycetaceae bacterium]